MKRIIVISFVVYLVSISSRLALPSYPSIDTYQTIVTDEGYELSGTVTLAKGRVTISDYSEPLWAGAGVFNVASDVQLSEIETQMRLREDEVAINRISGHTNLDAIVLSYIPIWLAVAFTYWIVSWGLASWTYWKAK